MELELFKDFKEEDEKEEESPFVINGDVYLNLNSYNGSIDLKKIRNKITKPLKRNIKKRDSQKCLCCGKKFEEHLQVHHIMPVGKFPSLATEPENLASLCQRCHDRYHQIYKGREGAVSFALYLKQFGEG